MLFLVEQKQLGCEDAFGSSPGLLRCSSLDRNLLCGAPPLPQPPLLVPRQGAELLRLPCLHCSFLDRERSCSASPASVARSSARTRRALPPPASAAPSSTGSRVFPLPSIHCSLLGTNAPSSASPGLICSSLDKEMSSTSPGLICSSLNKESSSASPASSAACRYVISFSDFKKVYASDSMVLVQNTFTSCIFCSPFAATGEEVSAEDLGGASMHCRTSGMIGLTERSDECQNTCNGSSSESAELESDAHSVEALHSGAFICVQSLEGAGVYLRCTQKEMFWQKSEACHQKPVEEVKELVLIFSSKNCAHKAQATLSLRLDP
ncbi:hypothetical protein Taro_041693, partial [Colocasia esculenta]|nr:hypothetical protein [Colocasia esculenta]